MVKIPEDSKSRSSGSDKVSRWIAGLVVAAAFALVVSLALLILARQSAPTEYITFDRLDVAFLNDNNVIEVPRVEGFEPPSVNLGDSIPARGQRCVDPSVTEQFDLSFDVVWAESQPEERTFVTSEDIKLTVPVEELGCFTVTPLFDMPEMVKQHIQTEGANSTWRVTGTVTPDLPNAETTTFETEAFLVVVEG